MKSIISIFLVPMFFLVGCGPHTHKINLNPKLEMAKSDIGKGREVHFTVSDKRIQKSLGVVEGGHQSSEVTSEQNLLETFEDKIKQGLKNKGFKISPSKKEGSPSLDVNIRLIKLTHRLDRFFMQYFYGQSTLNVVCNSGAGKMEKNIRVDTESHPYSGSEQGEVNNTISKVLQKMLDDSDLLSCLTS